MSGRGVYAIYDRTTLQGDRLALVEAVLAAGADWLQYRDKRRVAPDLALLKALLELTRGYGARLIVNDDWALARSIGADGVHLGATDGSIARARHVLGESALIGATCGDSLDRARDAIAAGADHVSFGRFFGSHTKPQAPPADLAVLGAARSLGVPVVAIGGIDTDNVRQVLAAGADRPAIAHALFHAPDAASAAERTRRLVAAMHDTTDASTPTPR